MKGIWRFLAVALLLLWAFAGCTGSGGKPAAETGKQYPIKGKVIAVDPGKSSVKLDHEEIPGLMPAMEMDYSVEDAKLLEGIKLDDQIRGELRVESGKYIITHLEEIGGDEEK